jgi:hypothetical protein
MPRRKSALNVALLVQWLDLSTDELNRAVCKRLSEYLQKSRQPTMSGLPRRKHLASLLKHLDKLATRHDRIGTAPAGADECLWRIFAEYLMIEDDEEASRWLHLLGGKIRYPALRDMLHRVNARMYVEKRVRFTTTMQKHLGDIP